MKNVRPRKIISRRSFITAAFLGTAGYWASCSNGFSARMLRELVAESGRGIAKPPQVPRPKEWPANGITAAWVGHSTVLVNMYGLTILTDPVFFRRIGLNVRLGTIGPKRLIAPALKINQLPPIDLVLLSHAHMDHFDMATLRCFPSSTRAVTASSTGDLLRGTKLKNAVELAWGQRTKLQTRVGEVELMAFPVKHWGARWRKDHHRGYTGFMLAREGKKFFYGGDTAYSENFAELRGKGPYDFAIMPIGSYQPWIMSHCNPEQAVKMTNEAGAKHLLPVHHKTFPLGKEGPVEPMERLQAALEKERIGWGHVGQTFSLT